MPADVVVRVVLHLPFLSGYAVLSRTRGAEESLPQPLRFDLDTAGERQDLVLQNYSDDLRADLSGELPHRVFQLSASLASPARVLKASSIIWHARTLDVDFWSVGVGLVTATYRLEVPADTPWSAIGSEVEGGRHIFKDRLASLRESSIHTVRNAVSSGELQGSGLLQEADAAPNAEALWTHIAFLIEAKDAASREQLDSTVEKLTLGGVDAPRPEQLNNVALRIGLDTGVGYLRDDASAAASIPRMVGVHTVVWAAAVDLDRRLLRLRRAERPNSLRGLEQQMTQTFGAYEYVQGFRTDSDAVPVHLSDLDAALWRAYAETWGLETHLSAVDARLASLQHVLSHATGVITSRRARVLSNLALAFTVAGIISVFGGLIDLSSKELRTPVSVNIWLVVGLVASAAALWLVLWGLVVRSAERGPPSQ